MTVLNLNLTFDDRHVVECSKALQAELPADQWLLLRQLAAELTALGESAALGTRMIVIPATAEIRGVEQALGLRVAGRE